MDESDVQSILERANQLLEQGKPAETLICLKGINEDLLEPDDRIECGALQAWAMSELGQSDQAVSLLEPLLDEFPESGRLHGTLGVVLSNAGDLEDACEELEEAVSLDPEDESALANLALVHERLREYERAQELYDKAIDLGADIDWLLQRKAAVQAELGDYPAAKQTLKRYLSLVPDDANEWISLAILHSDDEEFETAFQCYRQAEQIAPDSTSLRLNWGVSAVRGHDLETAAKQLRYLKRSEPHSSRPRLLEAFIREEGGELEAATRLYEDALQHIDEHDAGELSYALEMAMDFAARHGLRERCDELFARAYAGNACTVDLCEAYREAFGEPSPQSQWFSLVVEADYRPGLVEVAERGTPPGMTFTRYLRNVQVVAADRDAAYEMVLALAERMQEQNARIREFVGDETMADAHTGIYEIERESFVFNGEHS